MSAHPFLNTLAAAELVRPHGYIRKVAQGHFHATGPDCTVGDLCEIDSADSPVLAQVASADDNGLILVPLEQARIVRPAARVRAVRSGGGIAAGQGYAGRAVDGFGRPIDGGDMIVGDVILPLDGAVPRPFDRASPARMVATGLRAIDGLLTLGEGQRIGIFAAAGVGKTSLLEQLAAQVNSDRCVVCLVGERGREVEALWRNLSARDAKRFTLVAATSDESAALRARAANVALCLAEYWRDCGEHVLLVLDSVTRYALALREIGLAAGEPPTVRAYTPNVFAALPRLVERCGATRGGGSITAVMTVLSETDDVDDPIVEVMKSLLDGHILLSRTLAERGHFPAIDISRSISRQAVQLIDAPHAAIARAAVTQLGVYEEARVMIESGVYKGGANAEIDGAIATRARLMEFLRQTQDQCAGFSETLSMLRAAVSEHGHA